MAMDELVYRREALKRELMSLVKQIEEAAERYDPEDPMPIHDIVAVTECMITASKVEAYVDIIARRTMSEEAYDEYRSKKVQGGR